MLSCEICDCMTKVITDCDHKMQCSKGKQTVRLDHQPQSIRNVHEIYSL